MGIERKARAREGEEASELEVWPLVSRAAHCEFLGSALSEGVHVAGLDSVNGWLKRLAEPFNRFGLPSVDCPAAGEEERDAAT